MAFLDLCGFRVMMNTPKKAEAILDEFFRTVYEEVGNSRQRTEVVDCIVVSDCAVAFARTENSEHDDLNGTNRGNIEAQRLVSLLEFVERVAVRMITREVALKGSIMYGPLKYLQTVAGPGRVKAKFLGKAYLNAYVDVERGLPELGLGQIRIGPRSKIKNLLDHHPEFYTRYRIHPKKGNFYLYWMLRSLGERQKYDSGLAVRYIKLYDPIISWIKSHARRELDLRRNWRTRENIGR